MSLSEPRDQSARLDRMPAVKPVDPACFSQPPGRCFSPIPAAARPDPQDLILGIGPCIQRPNAKKPVTSLDSPWPFPARSSVPSRPESRPDFGQTSPSPAAPTAGGVVSSEPFWERPAGTPNTLAPNRLKARQLRYARQGLVRVSESNTKYGGQRGKTGWVTRL